MEKKEKKRGTRKKKKRVEEGKEERKVKGKEEGKEELRRGKELREETKIRQ